MKILDCNLCFGAPINGIPYKSCDSFEKLLEETDRCGISGGLVRCLYSNTVGVEYGNRFVSEEIKRLGNPDFKAVWAVLPPFTGETPDPEGLPSRMAENNVGALYIDPQIHRYPMNRLTLGKIFETAEKRRIPVLLSTALHVSIDSVYKIMEEYPLLTAVVSDRDCWPNARRLYPLAATYKNLCLDLSFVMDAGGVEDMTKRFGAEKLLFGTAFPERSTGSMMAVVRSADIDEKDRALIFGGNLLRLLSEEKL